MKIIKIAKKDSRNVVINFGDEQALFLSYEIFLKSGLRKNDEISEERFSFLIKENQQYAVKQRAFRYLARRPHSKNELRIKLRQKKYDYEVIEEALEELLQDNYLNDHEFAKSFAEENIKNKKWGKNKLTAELIKKGIDREIISEIANLTFDDESELDNAINLAEKKLRQLERKNLEKLKLKEKLYSYLSSKGYRYNIIKDAVNTILTEEL